MSRDDDPPSVLLLPDWRGGNPYQSNLATALTERDVPVAFGDVGGLFGIWRSVREAGDVDVVHLHWLEPYVQGTTIVRTLVMSLLAVAQLLLLRFLGVRLVWTVHNLTPHESPFPRIDRWLVGLVVRICDRFIVHCEAVGAEFATRYGGERTERRTAIIPHGHFIDNYDNGLSQATAREELSMDSSETVFLYFGRVRRYKGPHRLVDAFRAASVEGSRLLIVGAPHDPKFAEEVERNAAKSDRVDTVLEFVPDEEVQVYMNAADVVVLPYRDIATSGAAVLAMSFGKAIITPATGCNPEMIGDDGGFLYDGEADDGLRAAIRAAAGANLEAIGERNRRTIRANDWAWIAGRTEAVYRERL